ncbi:hypothetical protein HP567_007945 [Brevibacillus sp. M2.1A]|uniref:hypothetical protein n=1 Tax=unclassified Brevibacillus TaxID=2684853 RepID=UPI00156BD7ED|nr:MULTISPECIES: hypothetical protein [unclassified Brevibacillus]MCC8434482.1 hypothetical protein [Brevibacillus sp. M2.1A]MCE0452651.1 hypothetical protein [Brevibacillus sp. AF8]
MNVGKFHYVIYTVETEIRKNNLLALLDQFRSSFSTYLSQRSTESNEEFKSSLENFKTATDSCPSNNFTVSEQNILQQLKLNEMHGSELTGKGLYNKVLNALTINNVTLADALQQINEVYNNLSTFYSTIKRIDDSFTELQIEFDDMERNECEIGYLIPRDITDNTMKGLIHEFKSIDDFLTTIKEIVSEEASSTKIRTISNSEFQVFLESTPAVIGAVMLSVERVVALIRNIIETKKLYEEMKSKSIPAEITDPLKAYIDASVSEGINKLADQLVTENYKKGDAGRANELQVLLKRHLLYLADRIDKGATVEVRTHVETEGEQSEEQQQLTLQVENFRKLISESSTSPKNSLLLVASEDEKN